jgi:hypothetical protein
MSSKRHFQYGHTRSLNSSKNPREIWILVAVSMSPAAIWIDKSQTLLVINTAIIFITYEIFKANIHSMFKENE